MSLPTSPSRPRSSALALALGAPASSGVRNVGSDGLVVGGGRVANRGRRNCGSLGLGHIDGRGEGVCSDHGHGLGIGACTDNWLLGADLSHS